MERMMIFAMRTPAFGVGREAAMPDMLWVSEDPEGG